MLELINRNSGNLLRVSDSRCGNLDDATGDYFANGIVAVDETEGVECFPIHGMQSIDLVG